MKENNHTEAQGKEWESNEMKHENANKTQKWGGNCKTQEKWRWMASKDWPKTEKREKQTKPNK